MRSPTSSAQFLTPHRATPVRSDISDCRASILESKIVRVAADATFRQAIRQGGQNLERLLPRLNNEERLQIARFAADRSLDVLG